MEKITVKENVLGYMEDIVNATRQEPKFVLGASPRALLVLLRASQARAFLQGRDFVKPDEELHFLSHYEEFLYGNRQVSGHMMDLTLKEQEQLLQILKQKKPWTYWYYRIWS